jgi:hypothetical protein
VGRALDDREQNGLCNRMSMSPLGSQLPLVRTYALVQPFARGNNTVGGAAHPQVGTGAAMVDGKDHIHSNGQLRSPTRA